MATVENEVQTGHQIANKFASLWVRIVISVVFSITSQRYVRNKLKFNKKSQNGVNDLQITKVCNKFQTNQMLIETITKNSVIPIMTLKKLILSL